MARFLLSGDDDVGDEDDVFDEGHNHGSVASLFTSVTNGAKSVRNVATRASRETLQSRWMLDAIQLSLDCGRRETVQ